MRPSLFHSSSLAVEPLEARLCLDAANELFVTSIYPVLLERPIDPVGLTHWVADLDAGFLTREDVVVEIQESPEGRVVAIGDFYETLLNRSPDPVGLSSFLDFLFHHGHIGDVRIEILASDEYFQQAGGTTDGFLNAIYADILGRPIDPVGKTVWSDVVEFDGRIEAAFGIAESVEAHTRLVDEFYNELLSRDADAVGLEFFVGFLQDGGDERDVVAIILGSPEYAGRIELVESGCPATVSVTATVFHPSAPPENAFDCDESTSWNAGTYSGTITAQFARPVTFSGVVLTVNALPATNETYTIFGSNDGVNFTQLAEATRLAPEGYHHTLAPITFPTATYQYLRIGVDGNLSWVAIEVVRLMGEVH